MRLLALLLIAGSLWAETEPSELKIRLTSPLNTTLSRKGDVVGRTMKRRFGSGKAKYAEVSPMMAEVTNCGQFAMFCSLAGIQGFPVRAWYEHFHGQGSWKPEELEGM